MSPESFNEREGLERLDALFKEEKFEEAAVFASDLSETFPTSFPIGFLHYRVLVNLNRYSESEDILDGLLKQYPENINLLLVKGELLMGRGKTAESKLFFEKVLFLDPFNSRAKDGVDKVKSESADSQDISVEPKEVRSGLEDTMKEEDLERFLGESIIPDPDPAQPEIEIEEELDISLTEAAMEFESSLEEGENGFPTAPVKVPESGIKKDSDILENNVAEEDFSSDNIENISSVSDKVSLALENINSFSISEVSSSDISKDSEDVKVEDKKAGDEFVTESAALLYLKQGLYEDADSVYAKLYKESDNLLYMEKLEKIKRIKMANLKIKALEGFLDKIRIGSVRIV